MDIKQTDTSIDGIRTHILEAGEGPATVVLLHGGGVDNADLSWGLLIPELAQTHRVIAFDWPGYGESDHPRLAYSSDFNIRFLTQFLDALGIRRTHLAGISMGGAAALGFALQAPERVDRLVLVDSYGLQHTAPFHRLSYLMMRAPGMNALTWRLMRSQSVVRASLKGLLLRPGSVTEELVEKAARQAQKPGAALAWTTYQRSETTWSGTRTCYIDRLGEIRSPTLIVHGTKDSLVPVENAREAHVRILGSQLHWMEGCGHWPQRDNPKEFNRVVIRFLNEE